jgi:hypothetical protein
MLRIALIPLHINFANPQEKKIWSEVSIWPHITQKPSVGPCLWLICSLLGRRSIASCQVKILIFKGRLDFQMIFAHGHAAPWRRHLYMELTENSPEGSKAQDTLSCPSERLHGSKPVSKASHTARSSALRARQNLIFIPGLDKAWYTKSEGSRQISNRARYLVARGSLPYHQSSQNPVAWPFWTWKLEPSLSKCLILRILCQNWEPPWPLELRM